MSTRGEVVVRVRALRMGEVYIFDRARNNSGREAATENIYFRNDRKLHQLDRDGGGKSGFRIAWGETSSTDPEPLFSKERITVIPPLGVPYNIVRQVYKPAVYLSRQGMQKNMQCIRHFLTEAFNLKTWSGCVTSYNLIINKTILGLRQFISKKHLSCTTSKILV